MKSYFLYNFLIFLFKCFGDLRKLLHNALPHSFLSFSKTWWELSSISTLFCPWDMVLGETFYQNFSSTRNCNLVKFIVSDGVSNRLGRPNSESYSCNAFSWLFQDSWILSQSKTVSAASLSRTPGFYYLYAITQIRVLIYLNGIISPKII